MQPRFGKVVLGGLVGTLAMTTLMDWVGPRMGLMKMDIAQGLGSTLGIGWAAGLLLHFANGALIFPAIYTFGLYRTLPGTPLAKGLIWGAILWLLAQTIVMPMMDGGFFSANILRIERERRGRPQSEVEAGRAGAGARPVMIRNPP